VIFVVLMTGEEVDDDESVAWAEETAEIMGPTIREIRVGRRMFTETYSYCYLYVDMSCGWYKGTMAVGVLIYTLVLTCNLM
jgi:hypothetical protein